MLAGTLLEKGAVHMRSSDTIALAHGRSTVNKKKLTDNITLLTYAALTITEKLLYAISAIMLFIAVISAGDGKYSDGDTIAVLVSIGMFIVCIFAVKIAGLLKKLVKDNYQNKKRR